MASRNSNFGKLFDFKVNGYEVVPKASVTKSGNLNLTMAKPSFNAATF
jgi:hypothetical protein